MNRYFTNAVYALLMSVALSACSNTSKNISAPNQTDTITGNWASVATLMGPARYYAASFVVGNYGYVGAGRDSAANVFNDLWRYDPTNNSWSQQSSLPADAPARCMAVAFSINGYGYLGLGTDCHMNYFSDFYQYNPNTNSWTKEADFAGGTRYRATGFAIGNTGYVTCGMDSAGNYLKDMWNYNPTTNTWTVDIGSPGDKRVGAAAFVYNGEAYLIGGTNNIGMGCTQFYKFNQASDKWTTLRQITNVTDTDIFRTDGVAFVANTTEWGATAFVTTGRSADNSTLENNTWAYNFANDTWQKRTSYERMPRYGAVAFSINGIGYVGTGYSGNGLPYDNFDVFYPDQPYNAND
jgi:N-acetylneuraminic acid mutarotase